MKRKPGRGQTLVEYVLLIAVVSVVAIGVLSSLAQSLQSLKSTSDDVATALDGGYTQN